MSLTLVHLICVPVCTATVAQTAAQVAAPPTTWLQIYSNNTIGSVQGFSHRCWLFVSSVKTGKIGSVDFILNLSHISIGEKFFCDNYHDGFITQSLVQVL